MFDDHITIESPGNLPGIVRLNNLRKVHFSRNPKIAEILHQYEYVKEFGEGVDRLFDEMKNAELPDPEYTDNSFMLNATIRNGVINEVINEVINYNNGESNNNFGELNDNSGELNGKLNLTLLCLNKYELLVY